MKRGVILGIFFCYVVLIGISVSQSQQTPSQILSSGSAFYALSSRDLEVAKVYLLGVIAAQSTPNLVLSNAAPFYALSSFDLEVAQAYLLSQIQGNLGTNGGNFVLSLNGAATNVALWNAVNFNANLTATPYWRAFWADTHFFLTNVDNGGSLHLGASGQLSTTGGFLGDGSGLTNLNGSSIATGTVDPARLGSGAADATSFLRGDSTWQTVSGAALTPWTSDIDGAQFALTNAGRIVVSNTSGGVSTVISNGTVTTATNVVTGKFVTTQKAFFGNVNSAAFTNTSSVITFHPDAKTKLQTIVAELGLEVQDGLAIYGTNFNGDSVPLMAAGSLRGFELRLTPHYPVIDGIGGMYTNNMTNYIVIMSAAGGACTNWMPPVAQAQSGMSFIVMKDPQDGSGNAVTMHGNGAAIYGTGVGSISTTTPGGGWEVFYSGSSRWCVKSNVWFR